MIETIKDGVSLSKAGDKAKGGDAGHLPNLPTNDAFAAAMTDAHPPSRGIYAYTVLPKPCGCTGCTLGHIMLLGTRDVR